MPTVLSRLKFSRTLITLLLAALMFTASLWQRSRYFWKTELVKTYAANSSIEAAEFPPPLIEGTPSSPPEEQGAFVRQWRFHKVRLRGKFDYSRQFIVTNRRDVSGPGHHLFAPFLLEGTNKAILVSRGFIPFEFRTPETWSQYSYPQSDELIGVIQECLRPNFFTPSSTNAGTSEVAQSLWFLEDCNEISKQLPYPVIHSVFVQRLARAGDPPFPKEAVSIQVPPSTHYGYMIEWALLALLTLGIGIGLQLFPLRPLTQRGRLN